jgi:hypothetical protein
MAADHGYVKYLFERVSTRLAGFKLNDVENLVLPIENQSVVTKKHFSSLRIRPIRPAHLRSTRPFYGYFDISRST